VQFVAGCFWGGFTMLTVNFLLEAIPSERRIRAISYFNVLMALMVVAGSLTGAALIHRLPPLFGYSYLTLFLISCISRAAVMATAARRVREVRTA
jgi:MFS family permease